MRERLRWTETQMLLARASAAPGGFGGKVEHLGEVSRDLFNGSVGVPL